MVVFIFLAGAAGQRQSKPARELKISVKSKMDFSQVENVTKLDLSGKRLEVLADLR